MKSLLVVVVLAWPAVTRADSPAPDAQAVSDDQLAAMANAEAIEIYDERPDKPFDRDTEVRLTGEELAARGATDLGSALALLPDVSVRDGGRGGLNIDIRGARKGAVSILIDGVLVSDPYYGTFDVSTIPITDIVQIRVSTTPQSPIDGPGGPGGVIEVHTRDAIGPQLVVARLTSDSLPTFGMTGTARVPLSRKLALRISASGLGGARDLELPPMSGIGSIGEDRHAATGSARLEYRSGGQRIALDGFLDDRHYISPPSDTSASSILMIDRETTARATLRADQKTGKLQLQEQAWVDQLHRLSRYFSDPGLATQQQLEDLHAMRIGAMALATHPIGKRARWAVSGTVDHDAIDVASSSARTKSSMTLAELAADVQYERGTVRADLAGGVAVPFVTGGADPWPEGKLAVKWRPHHGALELTGTLARKGRVPSLRERFDPASGNPSLGPEMVDHAEVRAVEQLDEHVRLELAPFYKHSTGTVRVSTDPADMGKLVNLGTLDYAGVDAVASVRVHPRVSLGAAYGYIKVRQRASGTAMAVDDPLDRLPHHRAEATVQVTPVSRLSLLVRGQYVGRAIDKDQPTAAYTLIDATATATLSTRYLAVLRVEDLANVRPETRAGYHTAGRIVSLVLQGQW